MPDVNGRFRRVICNWTVLRMLNIFFSSEVLYNIKGLFCCRLRNNPFHTNVSSNWFISTVTEDYLYE